jgi:hypothetical protein
MATEADDSKGEAVFGSFDGMTSVLGVIAGLLGRPRHVIIAAAVGLAVASAVGMGAGEYLGDRDRSLRMAAVMAVATAVGTLLPVVPLLALPKLAGEIGAALVAVGLTVVIACYRRRWVETFGVLAVVAAATAAVAVVTGVTG